MTFDVFGCQSLKNLRHKRTLLNAINTQESTFLLSEACDIELKKTF